MIKIQAEVISILDNLSIEGNTVRISQQLDRPTYLAVNKVLESLGGQWDKRAKAHCFMDGNPHEAIEEAILTGTYSDKKKDFDFFETPAPFVARLVEYADIQPHHRIFEPSAGHGGIALAVREKLIDASQITVMDILPENTAYLVRLGFQCIMHGDFLQLDPIPEMLFDRIVMNPPFSRQADIYHVSHAWRFVKPGGRLVAVMSAGVRFRENSLTREFRQYFREHIWIDNPDGTFVPSGTKVNTITLIANREI